MTETSRYCDRREHDLCDGTVAIFDQDGPGRWTCCCSCHNARFDERDCPTCKGTGKIHERRISGREYTEPGPIPT